MKKKKDIAREMRRLAMDLGVRQFYVYVDLGVVASVRATSAAAIWEQCGRKLKARCEVNRDSTKFSLIHSIDWPISTCMRKDRSVVFQFDPEIERTIRRLRREQRNSKTVSGMNNLQDEGNLNPHGPLQLANIQEEQNEHANGRQPGNNNIIYMADDRDRAI
ncbi:hypothetical protein WN943_015141 [Citrus x changshan-huyou]